MKILIIERDIEEIKGIEWFLKTYLASYVEIESDTTCLQLEEIFVRFCPQIVVIETELLSSATQRFLQKQDVPIIALTAQPIFQQAMRAIQINAIHLFVKPVPLEELKSVILALPLKKQEVAHSVFVPTEAQLYLELYLKTPKIFNLQTQAFLLIEPAQYKDNLALYEWLKHSPIFDSMIALPLQKRIICLVQTTDTNQLLRSLRVIMQEWLKFSGEEINIAVYDGHETTLNTMYNDCKKVLTQRFYKGYSHIFTSAQSIAIIRLDPLLTPEQQQLWIASLEHGDTQAIKLFLYALSLPNTFYHHDDVRIHLTSILAQIRRFMMKYHLQQQAKIDAQYRELFHLILEHPILYTIVQELLLFTQNLMHLAKVSQQQLQVDYAELAVAIIERDYAKTDLSLTKVANELNISANYLSNLFSKKRGIPFKRYLQQHRVQQAERRLLQTDLPIAEIAEAVGFLDSNYFTKVFRDYYHVTPYRYRTQKEKNNRTN